MAGLRLICFRLELTLLKLGELELFTSAHTDEFFGELVMDLLVGLFHLFLRVPLTDQVMLQRDLVRHGLYKFLDALPLVFVFCEEVREFKCLLFLAKLPLVPLELGVV